MNRPYVKPSMLVCRRHPELGLWCREDGCVLVPAGDHNKAHWTYGSKDNHGKGYLVVKFRGKKYRVHRIICQTFHDNPLNLPTVDHINRIKTDNRSENLRFADSKMQQDNRQVCYDSLALYGVRRCEDVNAYQRAYQRERRARDPDYAERHRTNVREWQDRQRALGRRYRKCPDGKQHWISDEEYEARFENKSRQLRLF